MKNDEQLPIEQPHTDITTSRTGARGPRRAWCWMMALAIGLCLGATACLGDPDAGMELETESAATAAGP